MPVGTYNVALLKVLTLNAEYLTSAFPLILKGELILESTVATSTPKKALNPTYFTLLGMVIEVRLEQWIKAYLLTVGVPSGITRSFTS